MNLDPGDIAQIDIRKDGFTTIVYRDGNTATGNAWAIVEEAKQDGDTGLEDAMQTALVAMSIGDVFNDDAATK